MIFCPLHRDHYEDRCFALRLCLISQKNLSCRNCRAFLVWIEILRSILLFLSAFSFCFYLFSLQNGNYAISWVSTLCFCFRFFMNIPFDFVRMCEFSNSLLLFRYPNYFDHQRDHLAKKKPFFTLFSLLFLSIKDNLINANLVKVFCDAFARAHTIMTERFFNEFK